MGPGVLVPSMLCTGIWNWGVRTDGNWKRWPPWRRVAGLSGATGLSVLQKWMLDSSGLGVSRRVGVCSIAGVREAVGSEGLQRFMGEKSEAVTSRVGGLICRIFGGLRVFPKLWVLTVVLLLTEDELVSASTKLVSSPDRPRALSTFS